MRGSFRALLGSIIAAGLVHFAGKFSGERMVAIPAQEYHDERLRGRPNRGRGYGHNRLSQKGLRKRAKWG